MMNIKKGTFSGERDIKETQEFICRGDDSFFMLHALFSFPFVVGAKHIGVEDCTHCHLPACAPQVAVAPFGDSILTFEFSGFLKDGVNACAGNEDIHLLMMGIYFFNELWFDGGQFFFPFKGSFDAAFQDFLSVIIVNADGIISDFHDFRGGEVYSSTSALGNFFNDFTNFFLSQFSGDGCRGNVQEEFKHGFGKDVMFAGQFVKDICRDFVRGGFSQGFALFEVFDK